MAPAERISWLVRIVGTIVIVAGLHAGREFLVPCSIAVLLALLLAPISVLLERRKVPRLAAVLVTVIAMTSLAGSFGWLVTRQVAGVAGRLPDYHENVLRKTPELGPLGPLLLKGLDLLESAGAELSQPAKTVPPPFRSLERPVAGGIDVLGDVLLSLFNTLGTGFVVILLVIFLLIYRDDLRDRLIQLCGAGRVRVTTQTMDDAAGSVSRYLLMQSLVNLIYGAVITLILAALGIPNPLLWGTAAALSRFIPYFGPWLGAALPLFLSLAAFPGWTPFIVLAASWLALELLLANALEPVLYGKRTGLSPLAVLVAAVFWTWVWGGAGLLLSIPLTVSLVVLGKHFGPLQFLHTMLAEDASLEPRLRLYQRLLAGDLRSAEEIGEQYGAGRAGGEVVDSLLIPTLSLAQEDRQTGRLEDSQAEALWKTLGEVSDDLLERAGSAAAPSIAPGAAWGHLVLLIPTADSADDLSARMTARLLTARHVTLETLPGADTVGEKVRRSSERSPDLVVLISLHPSPLIPVRYLYKKVRAALPRTELLVALLDAPGDAGEWSERILPQDGPRVVTSYRALEAALEQMLPPLLVRKAALPNPAVP